MASHRLDQALDGGWGGAELAPEEHAGGRHPIGHEAL
eukprot:CAMPEP_0181203604 /NCGR_PEP_ID=MMETSP1096-20121128/19480_1 /TAXON_ID=156174 ORGANISM="Chrysochromulina ericina, Strain CCMP281" /NCGR_SAMPLE_ID=MMETSP1096 /ASSEMBLY_ACC=CAM_ASM_000453 /LENGTH=36 /DNA_ID= /DNA_START= /DNA_END= /DNA_ORIENTATION=